MSKDDPKPVKPTHGMDDAFPPSHIEGLMEEMIEQNDVIISLLKQLVNKGETNGEKKTTRARTEKQQSDTSPKNEVAKP